MPRYDFRCEDCGRSREASIGFEESRDLELACTACGGTMRVAPVMAVNILTGAKPDKDATPKAKTCGHDYPCRCHVKLSRPNPFAKQIRAARGAEED